MLSRSQLCLLCDAKHPCIRYIMSAVVRTVLDRHLGNIESLTPRSTYHAAFSLSIIVKLCAIDEVETTSVMSKSASIAAGGTFRQTPGEIRLMLVYRL